MRAGIALIILVGLLLVGLGFIRRPDRTSEVSRCAKLVRSSFPGAYDDLDDATLNAKVLAKYPHYCDSVR